MGATGTDKHPDSDSSAASGDHEPAAASGDYESAAAPGDPDPVTGTGHRVLSRRGALRAGAGLAGAAALGGAAAGSADAASQAAEPDYGGWFDDVDNYDGTVDRRGQDAVEITVGAEGNGGTFAFEPAAVRVDPGTELTFNWVSNTHNVLLESQPDGANWRGHEPIEDQGFSFSATLDVEGIYLYYCQPHRGLGMKGAIVVGDQGTGGDGGGTGEPDYGDWFGDVDNYDGTVDQRGSDQVGVTVGADGNGGTFAFEPAAVRIDPGTQVNFDWVSNTHNIMIESQPEGGGWGGHEPIEDQGFSYSHTFETEGVYLYYCQPHLSLGMKGAIVVGDVGAGGGDGEGGAEFPLTLGLQLFASALFLALASPLLLAAGLRLFGRDPETWGRPTEPAGAAAAEPAEPFYRDMAETAATEPARALDHESFDPVGTATLIVVYFLILVAMWVFMYFVEFLGGGPTVIG